MPRDVPVSVKRLVVGVDLEGLNVSAFCVEHGISSSWFYELRRPYRLEGEAGLEPKSRANTGRVANKTSEQIEDLIVRLRKRLDDEGLDAGPGSIRWHLINDGEPKVPSESTIWRVLARRGFIVADPTKAPNKQWQFFEADRANQLWQIDGTDWGLANGDPAKIINIIDDASRLSPASLAAPTETHQAAFSAVIAASSHYGLPERILHDNGSGLVKLDKTMAVLGIANSRSRVHHPQTCGKVERFHQTLKKWLAQQDPAATLAQLQSQLDTFRDIYNNTRPHRSLPNRMPPAQRWDQLPKAGPSNKPLTGPTRTFRNKVSTNGVCNAGRNCAISLGNKHAHKTVDIIITANIGHVFDNGKLIRKLTINPNRRVQALHPRPGRPQ